MNVFTGTFVQVPYSGAGLEIFHDHILTVNKHGVIQEFLPAADNSAMDILKQSATRIDAPTGSFFLPTFCDLHLHAAQFLYLGTGLHLPLMTWLGEYAYKAEERLDDDPQGLGRKVYTRLAKRLIESGTGAALMFGTIKSETNIVLAEAFQKAGLRAFVGKLSMDKSSRPTYVEESASMSHAAAESFIERCKGVVAHLPEPQRLIEPVITPRFVPTCSHDLLSSLGQLAAQNNIMVQSHMSEARDQVEWVISENGANDFEIFKQHGLLTSRTIQAHCTFLPEPLSSSLHALSSLGTAVAHCPLSNAYFSSLPFPLREAIDADVKIGLGSDVAGGYSVDLLTAMRQAVITSRTRENARLEAQLAQFKKDGIPVLHKGPSLAVHWTDTVYLATKGGAEALGLTCGSFRPGASFDAQQINLVHGDGEGVGALDFFDPVEKLTPEHVEKWWCQGTNTNRSAMWVQGQKIL